MADPNRALFESVVRLLGPVLNELVFVGGCTTGLLLTDSAAGGIRPTTDVDAIVDVVPEVRRAVRAPSSAEADGRYNDGRASLPLALRRPHRRRDAD